MRACLFDAGHVRAAQYRDLHGAIRLCWTMSYPRDHTVTTADRLDHPRGAPLPLHSPPTATARHASMTDRPSLRAMEHGSRAAAATAYGDELPPPRCAGRPCVPRLRSQAFAFAAASVWVALWSSRACSLGTACYPLGAARYRVGAACPAGVAIPQRRPPCVRTRAVPANEEWITPPRMPNAYQAMHSTQWCAP